MQSPRISGSYFLDFLHRAFHQNNLAKLVCIISGKFTALDSANSEKRDNYIKESSGNLLA